MVRGTITAATGDHLTVKTEAGDIYQVVVTNNTRLMKARQPIKISQVKSGDGLGAMGVLDGPTKTLHAVMVNVIDAAEVQKAREDLGKLYIVGRVTAIDELNLTIKRTDGVAQVIQVDEGTSFKRGGQAMATILQGTGGFGGEGMGGGRRGGGTGSGAPPEGESITLMDVKVGDTVAGKGGLKNGVFVPTELGVMAPRAGGQRRRRASGTVDGSSPAESSGSNSTPN
jgi:hypothetical protein